MVKVMEATCFAATSCLSKKNSETYQVHHLDTDIVENETENSHYVSIIMFGNSAFPPLLRFVSVEIFRNANIVVHNAGSEDKAQESHA